MFAWLAGVFWVCSLSTSAGNLWLEVALPNTPGMCRALPSYGDVLGSLRNTPEITLALDITGSRATERQFCAQYGLAPIVLRMRSLVDRRIILDDIRTGPVLIDDAPDAASHEATQHLLRSLLEAREVELTHHDGDKLILLKLPRPDGK